MTQWTEAQVLDFAPDARAVASARSLAARARWSDLGANESLVWGRCRGSARAPYQVTVDLAGPAFRCTCPSRKQPCKHALALLLRWVATGGAVADGAAPPEEAADWLARRAERRGRTEARARRGEHLEPVVDPEGRARRQAERAALMSAGLDDFDRWLSDLVRQGLARARHAPYEVWDTAAARLVDAQCGALAERVRETAGLAVRGDRWADALLTEAARWWSAIAAWRRRAELPADTLADLRVVLGWPYRRDDLADAPRLDDRWHVVGLRRDGDDRLQSQRTWLWGEQLGALVMVLDFAAAGDVLDVPHMVGSIATARVVKYPGHAPWRVAFTGDAEVVGRTAGLPNVQPLRAALAGAAHQFAANPWLERAPVLLRAIRIGVDDRDDDDDGDGDGDNGGGACAIDECGDAVAVIDTDVWSLLARTGGAPVDVLAEWDGESLAIVTASLDGALVSA